MSGSNQREEKSRSTTFPTLPELGINREQSSKWQQLANVPKTESSRWQALADVAQKQFEETLRE